MSFESRRMRKRKYPRIESEIFLLSMESAPNLVIHFITQSLTQKKGLVYSLHNGVPKLVSLRRRTRHRK